MARRRTEKPAGEASADSGAAPGERAGGRRLLDGRERDAAERGPVRVSVSEFLARQRAGALPAGPRAELVDGRLVVPPLPKSREVAAVVGVASRLEVQLLGRARLSFLPALRVTAFDLLRPDLALLDAAPRFGRGATRPAGAALLVVEVERGPEAKEVRLPLYARSGVAETWLLQLERRWVEAYRVPAGGRYRSRTLHYPGEKLELVALDGVQVEVLPTV